jgi:hypothetical protein
MLLATLIIEGREVVAAVSPDASRSGPWVPSPESLSAA